MTPTVRRRAPSPGYGSSGYGSGHGSGYGSGMSDYMFQSLVRPSVVRPSRYCPRSGSRTIHDMIETKPLRNAILQIQNI